MFVLLIWFLIFIIAFIITFVIEPHYKKCKKHSKCNIQNKKISNNKIYGKSIYNDMTSKTTKNGIKYFIYNTLYFTDYRITQGYYTHSDKISFKIEFKKYFKWIEYTKELETIEIAGEVFKIILDEIEKYYSNKNAYKKNKKIIEIVKFKNNF